MALVRGSCGNCRSAHKGCNREGPPCGRCIEFGLEKSCCFPLISPSPFHQKNRSPKKAVHRKKLKKKHNGIFSSVSSDAMADVVHIDQTQQFLSRFDKHPLPKGVDTSLLVMNSSTDESTMKEID